MSRVGINDGSHFTRDFKDAYGLTPEQLKRSPLSELPEQDVALRFHKQRRTGEYAGKQ